MRGGLDCLGHNIGEIAINAEIFSQQSVDQALARKPTRASSTAARIRNLA
jgi:hypothetical protein